MIPALAFNDAKEPSTNNIQLLGDKVAAALPKVKEFTFSDKKEKFTSKSSAITINGLEINASSHNGVYIERENPLHFDLVIPIDGYVKAKIDCVGYAVVGGSTALISSSECHTSISAGSNIVIRLNQPKLDATYASMIAGDAEPAVIGSARILKMEYKKLSFFNLFRTLMNQIDCANGNPTLLAKLAFEDRLYRLSAGLIYPELLLSDEPVNGRRPQGRSELDTLCEYLRANLRQPLSLTQMEQMSGLSSRKLQYAFRKEFGMDARVWVRKQRLHAARSALLDTHEHTTVEFVAYDFCFVSPSEFSRHYLQEFGELPEQSFRRGRS